MKTLISKIVTERLKELEGEYLMSLIIMKTFIPDDPVPLFNTEAMEKKVNDYLSEMDIFTAEDSYMTIKEAMDFLKVSRNTLFLLRKQGMLTSYSGQGGVYLLRKEVEKLLKTYSKKKGKI